MNIDQYYVGAAYFDETRHCLVPSDFAPDREPISIVEKVETFIRINRASQDFARYSQILNATCPVAVPYAPLDGKRAAPNTSEIIIMSPTPCHTPTMYDLYNQEDRQIFVANQMLAFSWEMTRQALLALGAQVKVTSDIYPNTATNPLMATDGTVLPIPQIFARDPGVIVGDIFFTPGEQATHKSLVCAAVGGQKSFIDKLVMGGLINEMCHVSASKKQDHARAVVAAFGSAGKQLTLKTIDAFFEGGDVIVDSRKGLIFVGYDEAAHVAYHGVHGNIQSLQKEFGILTGCSVVVIERPLTLDGNTRQNGERFHLDTFMNVLPKGELLIDSRYTSQGSLDVLKKIYGDDVILIGKDNLSSVKGPAGDEDVPIYPPNLVPVGDTLLMPSCSTSLKSELQQRGYQVVSPEDFNVPLGYTYMRGGSMHCITHTVPQHG